MCRCDFQWVAEQNTLRIRLKNDFGLSLSPALPSLGSASQGLRVMSESWSTAHDSSTVEVAGAQGKQYEIGMWNPAQVSSVEGAELTPTKTKPKTLKSKSQFRRMHPSLILGRKSSFISPARRTKARFQIPIYTERTIMPSSCKLFVAFLGSALFLSSAQAKRNYLTAQRDTGSRNRFDGATRRH